MPKPAQLDIDLNEPSQHQPTAAAAPRMRIERPAKPEPPKNDTPVNFRWPRAEVKALKRAALDADMTLQAFLLSCFHQTLQGRKKA